MIFQRVKAKLAILSLLLLPVALVSCGEENTTTTKPTVTTTSSEDSNFSSVEESNSDVTTVEESNTETTVEETSTETSADGSNTVITYHVIFQNYDLTTLYETDVNQGEDVTYQGETPTKPEDDEFTYEFKGWDKELTNIQEDITFTAQYKEVPKENWGPIHWF